VIKNLSFVFSPCYMLAFGVNRAVFMKKKGEREFSPHTNISEDSLSEAPLVPGLVGVATEAPLVPGLVGVATEAPLVSSLFREILNSPLV
ncbi:MAG: hypothetical protein RID07_09235, partial [Lacipirellulaceae bacterium]